VVWGDACQRPPEGEGGGKNEAFFGRSQRGQVEGKLETQLETGRIRGNTESFRGRTLRKNNVKCGKCSCKIVIRTTSGGKGYKIHLVRGGFKSTTTNLGVNIYMREKKTAYFFFRGGGNSHPP